MGYPDDPVTGILGIKPVSGERDRRGQERRASKPLPRKPGKDRVDISPRARRLADIEELLGDGVSRAAETEDQADGKT